MPTVTVTPELVAKYLAGALPPADAEAFEALYASRPELVRELEETLRLQEGLAILRDRGELEPLLRAPRARRVAAAAAIAASLVAVAFGAALLRGGVSAGPVLLGASPARSGFLGVRSLPVARRYTLVTMRGAGEPIALEIPTAPAAIELRALPAYRAASARYRATVERMAGASGTDKVVAVDGLAADADGFVVVYLDSRALAAGRYSVTIAPLPAPVDSPRTRFVLDAIAAGGPSP